MASFIAKRGATFRRQLQWLEDGVPVDLTGCTGVCAFGHPGGTSAAGVLSVVVTDAVQGKLKIEALASATAVWGIGKYVLDLVLTFPGGDKIATESVDFYVEGSQALG